MNIIKTLILFSLLQQAGWAQIIPAERRTDWSLAGYQDSIPTYSNVVNITSFGAVGDGITINNTALQNAISSLNGGSGTIYFPTGNFKFNANIVMPDSLVLKGNSSDSTSLSFDLGGGGDLITMSGSISANAANLSSDAYKDSTFIMVSNPALFTAGDYLKISQNDSSLVFSSWAYGSVGQIVQVQNIVGNRINLNSPLRKNYLLTENVKVRKITARKNSGIECLKIVRLDSSPFQTTNIDINYSVKCWIKGIESDMCNFAHVAVSNSSNIEISGCFFHDAFAYGGGGQGYGVVLQFTSGECLVENNIFNHLRHSMLLQAGANGNVLGYNASTNPYWVSGFLPTNSAGDLVLHGNYVFLNLFEGNTGQNIVIDDSHGSNGPYNTFFRNRGDTYGIFMNNNPASNNQNLIGNEVTSTASLQGLYNIAGTGHLLHGNNIKGIINPANTNTLNDNSYYRNTKPGYFMPNAGWPSIGIPNAINSGTIPAKQRNTSGIGLTDCRIIYPLLLPDVYASIADTFCSGTSFNFNGITIATGGIYTDTMNIASGYDSIITLELTEVFIDTAVTINGLILTANETNAAYRWIDCSNGTAVPGATAQNFSPTENGSYKLEITKDNCLKESICFDFILTSLLEFKTRFFSLAPNPANNILKIKLEDKHTEGILQLFNVSGKRIIKTEVKGHEISLDVTGLESGFYFVTFTEKNGKTSSEKLIIQ